MLPDRDNPEYPWHQRPDDHSIVGLFVDGPRGELSVLAVLIAYTHCAISAATPENERKQHVAYKARRVSNGGRFTRDVKPASSGRRRKAA